MKILVFCNGKEFFIKNESFINSSNQVLFMRGCRSLEKTKAKLGLSLTGRKAKIGFAKLKFSRRNPVA